MKIIRNNLIFIAKYASAETAIVVYDKVVKTIDNVHDLHREYSDDYKIHYTKEMIEQIRKHESDYNFVYEIIASVMKICELPEAKCRLERKGKKIRIVLANPYISRTTRFEINERNIWAIMFKKETKCPKCEKINYVNAGSNAHINCECGHKYRMHMDIDLNVHIEEKQQSLPLG